jgi:hypothetical protein
MKDYTTTFTVTSDAGNYGGKLDMSIAISQDSSLEQILEVFERMSALFSPLTLRSLTLRNRIGASPSFPMKGSRHPITMKITQTGTFTGQSDRAPTGK